MTTDDDDVDVRPHLVWQLEQLTRAVPVRALTTAELWALVSVLIPAHSRVLEAAKPTAEVLPFVVRRNSQSS